MSTNATDQPSSKKKVILFPKKNPIDSCSSIKEQLIVENEQPSNTHAEKGPELKELNAVENSRKRPKIKTLSNSSLKINDTLAEIDTLSYRRPSRPQ